MRNLADIAEAFLQIHLSKKLDPSVEFDLGALSLDDAMRSSAK